MGWTTSNRWTRKSLIQELTQYEVSRHSGTIHECLAHCYKGAPWKGTLWVVWKLTRTDGTITKFIACYLLQWSNYEGGSWGYKDLEAGMGLTQTNCPLSYLLMEKYDYDYEKGYFIEWVGRVLTDYKKKESPLYLKALKAFPNAIQIHLDEKAKRDSEPPFVFKKMVHFSEIIPKGLLEAMKGGPVVMLEADDKAYDQMIIDQAKNLTNPE